MPDFLTRRHGTWHFVRRVPSEFAEFDNRGIIRHSTKVRVSEELLEEFPDMFELRYFPEQDVTFANFCIIDANIPKRCVVEMMMSMPQMIGSREVKIAGSAIFIERNQNLAKSFEKLVSEIKKQTKIIDNRD